MVMGGWKCMTMIISRKINSAVWEWLPGTSTKNVSIRPLTCDTTTTPTKRRGRRRHITLLFVLSVHTPVSPLSRPNIYLAWYRMQVILCHGHNAPCKFPGKDKWSPSSFTSFSPLSPNFNYTRFFKVLPRTWCNVRINIICNATMMILQFRLNAFDAWSRCRLSVVIRDLEMTSTSASPIIILCFDYYWLSLPHQKTTFNVAHVY